METNNKTEAAVTERVYPEVFSIPEQNLWELNSKLEAMNKRAAKLGVAPVTTEVVSMFTQTAYETMDGRRPTQRMYSIRIHGLSPKLEGWTFIGTLEHTPAGNILRGVPGQIIPEAYRQGVALCEHCNKIRRRKDTYIVRHENGAHKQVGHNCIRDFLGTVDPRALAMMLRFLREIDEATGEEYSGGGRVKPTVPPLAALEYSAQCVLQFGWLSRGAAQKLAVVPDSSGAITATADYVWKYLFPTKEMREKGDTLEISHKATEIAKAALAHFTNPAFISKNQYEGNLHLTLSFEELEHKHIGIAASAIAAYQKTVAAEELNRRKIALRREQAATMKHIGEIGKREVFTLTLERCFALADSQYGENRCVYTFRDADNNMAVWFTNATDSLIVGNTYKVKATVKKHDAWKEMPQTLLTRCKIEEQI